MKVYGVKWGQTSFDRDADWSQTSCSSHYFSAADHPYLWQKLSPVFMYLCCKFFMFIIKCIVLKLIEIFKCYILSTTGFYVRLPRVQILTTFQYWMCSPNISIKLDYLSFWFNTVPLPAIGMMSYLWVMQDRFTIDTFANKSSSIITSAVVSTPNSLHIFRPARFIHLWYLSIFRWSFAKGISSHSICNLEYSLLTDRRVDRLRNVGSGQICDS